MAIGGRRAFLALALAVSACTAGATPSPPPGSPTAEPTPTPEPTDRPTPGPTASPSPSASATPTPTAAPSASLDLGAVELSLDPFVDGLDQPVHVTAAPDGSGRLYVVERAGRILVVEGGRPADRPFLDIRELVGSDGGEQGLLSVAFHPGYAANGRLFVDYTDRSGDTVVAEYARSAADPLRADPGSERVLLAVEQPYPNHNGGLVLFGPDGMLYVGLGDGGAGGDPHDAGQRGDTLLGKLLRIGVDPAGDVAYAIPADNPFARDDGVRDEIWALGLRNPWRFSFDRSSGDLWIADVGQGDWEEIDFAVAGAPGGANYGWNRMEGPGCFTEGCDPSRYVAPVAAYDHGQGCSVTGGYVYRGRASPALAGAYLFGDYCSGRIWGLDAAAVAAGGAAGRPLEPVLLLESGLSVSSFGEDGSGEIYLVDLDGAVYRIVARGG